MLVLTTATWPLIVSCVSSVWLLMCPASIRNGATKKSSEALCEISEHSFGLFPSIGECRGFSIRKHQTEAFSVHYGGQASNYSTRSPASIVSGISLILHSYAASTVACAGWSLEGTYAALFDTVSEATNPNISKFAHLEVRVTKLLSVHRVK